MMDNTDITVTEDLRSTIGNAFDEQTKEIDITNVAEENIEPTEEQKADRSRDDKGRFAKKEEKQEEAPEEVKDFTAEKPPTEKSLPAPPHWRGAEKVRWEKLPVRVQEALLKDHEDMAKKGSKYDSIEKVLEPRRQQLLMQYGDEAKALNQLFAYSDYAAKDPAGFIQYFAKERGIDLSQFVQQQGQEDPQYTGLIEQINQLKQHVASLTGNTASVNTHSIQSEIDNFARDPKYPYFNDVRAVMGAIIATAAQKGQQMTLAQAYEQAILTDPNIRAEIEESKRSSEEAKRAEEEAARVKKLNEAKAAKTIKGSPSGMAVNDAPAATVREAALRAWDALAS